MGQQVVNGAALKCSFGAAPGTLSVLPANRVMAGGQPAANIQDSKPMVNITGFSMCMSPSNPQVAAATSAAMGVLTPQPCIPVTPAPWTPGAPQTTIAGMPALESGSQCSCNWGGMITVSFAGQATVTVQ